jgi:transposase-like protein
VTVKTTAGPVQLSRPKLRGTTEAFASRLFGSHVTKTNALESLVIASFVRGLSVRDVEAALAEALGDQAAISKSTVSSAARPAPLPARTTTPDPPPHPGHRQRRRERQSHRIT